MKYTNFQKSYGRAKEKEGGCMYLSHVYDNGKWALEITVKNEKEERMTIILNRAESIRFYEQVFACANDELKRTIEQ